MRRPGRRDRARSVPTGAAASLRGAAARPIAARGLAEAENELQGFVRVGEPRRRRLRPSRRGRAAARAPAEGRRASARTRARRFRRIPSCGFAVAPARRGLRLARARSRPAAGHPGLPQEAARAPTPGSAALSRASPTCGWATTSSTRTTASGSSSGSTPRRSPASRATTSISRSAARTGCSCRTSRSGSCRGTSAPTRPPRRSRSSAGRHGRTSRRAPGLRFRSWRASSLQLYAQRQRAEGTAFEVESDWLEQLEASFPYRETDDQQRAIEAVKEDLESRPADGPARLRRRRLRQDGGRRPRGVRGRRQQPAGARALPDDDPRGAALEHLPRALPRLPRAGRDGLALPPAGRGEGGAEGVRRRGRSTCSSARIGSSPAT